MNRSERLNQQFEIPGCLHFRAGNGGLTKAVIENRLASAEIYLHGAHITSFVPANETELLWMSELARFEPGAAIRGGIPVIWPWFGAHDSDTDKPQHGFARTTNWHVSLTRVLAGGETQLNLRLVANESTRKLWDHDFDLQLQIIVGEKLQARLVCKNTGTEAFTLGAALHSYFLVSDIGKIRVTGLEDRDYIDQLDHNRRKHQGGPLAFQSEVDRIYLDSPDDCVIDDPDFQRQIIVSKSGSLSTVVWNPWIEKARSMADFPNQGYRHMLCIESANAGDDVRRLEPGERHCLEQIISV